MNSILPSFWQIHTSYQRRAAYQNTCGKPVRTLVSALATYFGDRTLDGQFGSEEFIFSLRILDSYIVRRMVVGVPSNSLSSTFVLLCKVKPVTDCGSSLQTLLVPVSDIKPLLAQMSVTNSDDRHYWHVVAQRKNGKLVLRLLGAMDGPDLTEFLVSTLDYSKPA